MSDVLLTLGLPVYNGSNCVQDTLRSINNALKKVDQNKIEVLVSNNASEDNTFLVVQNLCNKLNLNISLYSEESNIQYDGNIDKIVRRAKGRYVWFIGCGETIKQDALCRVIKYLDIEYEYTNILLDFDIYDEIHGWCEYGIYDFNKKVILKGKNNFEYNRYAPAVSSNIVNKELWMRVIKHELVANGWCHVERILDMIAISNNSTTLLLSRPYFTLYREEDGWWTKPNSYLLLLLHIDIVRSMTDRGFSKKVAKRLESQQTRLALIQAIIQSRDYGLTVDSNLLYKMIHMFKKDYFFWIFVIPALFAPKALIKTIMKILKFSKKYLKNVYKYSYKR